MSPLLATWASGLGATPAANPAAATPWARFPAAPGPTWLWDLSAWGVLRLQGKDPAAFLNKYLTQEVKSLTPGQTAYGCALTIKGGLVTDLWAVRRADDLLAITPPAGGARLAEHLRRYALLDRTPLGDAGLTLLGLVGPRAEELSRAAPALLSTRLTLCGVEALVLGVAPAEAPALAAALVAAGASPVGLDQLDPRRVTAVAGLLGVDLDESTIPIEAGLEERAISFTKGCYLGQEVIARIAHRGHVNRHLRRLDVEGPPLTCPAPLFAEEKEVTRLTTSVPGAGLALVHRKYPPGTALRVGAPDGPRALVL